MEPAKKLKICFFFNLRYTFVFLHLAASAAERREGEKGPLQNLSKTGRLVEYLVPNFPPMRASHFKKHLKRNCKQIFKGLRKVKRSLETVPNTTDYRAVWCCLRFTLSAFRSLRYSPLLRIAENREYPVARTTMVSLFPASAKFLLVLKAAEEVFSWR